MGRRTRAQEGPEIRESEEQKAEQLIGGMPRQARWKEGGIGKAGQRGQEEGANRGKTERGNHDDLGNGLRNGCAWAIGERRSTQCEPFRNGQEHKYSISHFRPLFCTMAFGAEAFQGKGKQALPRLA
jgi:hypothetical protein